MKNIYLLLFIFVFQSSYSQDVLIENQADLDGLTPPTTITGNLSIISDGTNDIFDLTNLGSLTTITGTLIIQNNLILSTLDDLSSLTTISGGTITIQNNANLYSFCGLSGIGTVTETISGNSYNPTYADIIDAGGTLCKAADVVYNDTANDRFNTQVEIDALPDGITHITDELIIGLDAATNDITDLSKFSKLRDIGGRLLIQKSPLLTDLSGFSALEIVGSASAQEFVVRENDLLTTLNGLQALRTVSRRIGVWSNPKLETLEGLNNLKLIKDNVTSELIRIGLSSAGGGNPLLEDFCALEGIINIIGAAVLDADPLSFINNETTFNPTFTDISNGTCTSVFTGSLTVTTQAEVDALPIQYTHITGRLDILGGGGDISDLSKFSDLKDLGRRLLIQDCPSVTDMTGFSSLEAIGSLDANEELVIRRMDGLTTLNGLQTLTSVGRRVGIRQNPVLTTLEGLNNLQTIGENKINIGDAGCGGDTSLGNATLVDYCALQTLISTIGVSTLEAGGSCISGNAAYNPTFTNISGGTCTLSVNTFAEESFSIYPNPVSTILTIKSFETLDSIKIINALGMEVLKTTNTELNISHLPTGLYFVKISAGNKSAIQKILKL
jgi:hypothetical protein